MNKEYTIQAKLTENKDCIVAGLIEEGYCIKVETKSDHYLIHIYSDEVQFPWTKSSTGEVAGSPLVNDYKEGPYSSPKTFFHNTFEKATIVDVSKEFKMLLEELTKQAKNKE